jgi:hypothetical protein
VNQKLGSSQKASIAMIVGPMADVRTRGPGPALSRSGPGRALNVVGPGHVGTAPGGSTRFTDGRAEGGPRPPTAGGFSASGKSPAELSPVRSINYGLCPRIVEMNPCKIG